MSKPLDPKDAQFILNVRIDKKYQYRIAAAQHLAGVSRGDLIETALEMLLPDPETDTMDAAKMIARDYVEKRDGAADDSAA
ncbi:hypothetical protein ACTXOW_07000 [Corynebacterium variabile]|uniref:hypothetical protein n=1 Tax=Corynebacterium variabile TaxID=1727 RepID=UPI003FD1E955